MYSVIIVLETMVKQKQKAFGFTLIELLVVTTIIGLLVGISLPGVNHYIQRIRLSAAVDTVENTIREGFSRARSGPFYPVIFISTEEEDVDIIFCERTELRPDFLSADKMQEICQSQTLESIQFEGAELEKIELSISNEANLLPPESVSWVGIEYYPPYADFLLYSEKSKAFAYPSNEASLAVNWVEFTFTNGEDFQQIKLWQTGLIERFTSLSKSSDES